VAAIVTALDARSERRLLPALAARGHTVVARPGEHGDLVATVLAARPSALVVQATPRLLTRELIAHCDDLGIRLIALAADHTGRRRAAALGFHEVVDADIPAGRLADILDGEPIATVSALPVVGRTGTVIVVWGPAGAPGRTTVAITLATEIAASGHTVALVDADTHAAAIAPALGMLDEAPGFAAACRLASQDALTLTELDRIQQPYPVRGGRLSVLTGITRPSRWPELGAERVTATLERCREWADYVVVDVAASLEHDEEISSDLFAPRRNAATLAALRAADRVVAVGAADPIGLARYLRGHTDLLETVGDVPITTVINRVRASVSGIAPAGQVRQALARFGGVDDPVIVPNDPRAADAALAAGRAIRDVAPRSQALGALRAFVSNGILPAPDATSPRRAARRGRLAG